MMIRQIIREARDVVVDGVPSLSAVPRPPIRWLDPPAGPWTVARSYEYCEEFARAHTESYPVASRFVAPELRPHLVALYAFARSADDFADEPEYEGRRTEALGRWEEALHRCFHGEAEHPVFIALADTIDKRDLPVPPLHDMLTAFRMDLEVRRYATFQALARLHGPLGGAGGAACCWRCSGTATRCWCATPTRSRRRCS